MRSPISSPTDVRFHLGQIGIDSGNDFSVISGYGCLRLLEHIVKIRNWQYPYAAYKNDAVHQILAAVFPEAVEAIDPHLETPEFWKTFADTYSSTVGIPFKSFVKNVCPSLVVDPDACLRFLASKIFDTRSTVDISWCLHTIIIWKVRAESAEQSFAVYCNLLLHTGLPALSLEDFCELYTAVNCYSLSSAPRTRADANAAQASRIFSAASIPTNFQIDLFELLHNHVKSKVGIKNAFQYIRKTANAYSHMFDSMAHLEKEFNRAADLLLSVKASDFLETLMTMAVQRRRGDIPDSATECSYIYTQFKNYLVATKAKKVLITNPSIPFIRKWSKDESLTSIETYFMMNGESSANILTKEFSAYPHCKFIPITAFSMTEEYDSCLLFYRNYADENNRHMEFGGMLVETFIKGAVFWLLPDEKAKKLIGGLSSSKLHNPDAKLDAIDILPTEVFTSTPKKKILLRIAHHNTRESIDLDACFYVRDPILGKVLYPIRKAIKTSLETLNGEESIRTIYRNEGILSKTERKRKLPKSYQFSPELTIWYTLNQPQNDAILTPKVKAYLCDYPSPNQRSRNILKRGKEIAGAHIWKTNFSEDAICSWIGFTAVFSPQIHQAAVKIIEAQYKRNPISLRTFWYIHQPSGLSLETKQDIALNQFIRGTEVEKLKVGISLKDDYVAAVDQFFENRFSDEDNDLRDEYLHYVWDFLCDLLDTAVEKEYYKINPVEDLVSRVRSRHSEFSELRDALTKKTFTQDEEMRILEEIQNDGSPLAIGAMIRLYTGMPNMQVCALRYRDFKAIPHTGNYQFLVYQRIAKAGSSPTPLKRPEEYRRIPVAPILAEYINKHIQHWESTLHTKVKGTDYYIVSEDLQVGKCPEDSRPYAPSTLHKYCKRIIQAIGIEHVTLSIPDEESGTKESDFSQYQSDIFRTNLRYRLKNTCGFTNSECDYMLGIQLKNTFAKHYCDFTNPFSQITMLTKLSWWCALHQPSEEAPKKKQLSLRNSHLSVEPIGTGCASAALSLQVAPAVSGTPAEVAVAVESNCGCTGSINVIREGTDNET